jgi:acetylornithine/succinyldiaminopimelate/putrescine aminotransferase
VAGFLCGITIRADPDANDVSDRLIDQRFIVRALRGDTLQVSPPFTNSDED